MPDKLYFYFLGKTVGNYFTGGETIKQVKPIVNELSLNGFNVAINYMAEFDVNVKHEESFFDNKM